MMITMSRSSRDIPRLHHSTIQSWTRLLSSILTDLTMRGISTRIVPCTISQIIYSFPRTDQLFRIILLHLLRQLKEIHDVEDERIE